MVLRLSVWVYVFFYVVALLVEVRLASGRGLGPFAWWFCSFITVTALVFAYFRDEPARASRSNFIE